MLKPHYYSVLLTAAFLLVFTTCQQPQTAESLYPENEIPANTESEEALKSFVSGLDIFDLNDNQAARPLFDAALEKDPDFVTAQMYRAFCSSSPQDWGEQTKKLLALRDKADGGETLMIDLVQAILDNDEMKELEVSKKMVDTYPNSARAQHNLSQILGAMDQHEKSREHLTKALELNPDFIPAMSGLGASYLFASPKDFKKAEEYMAKVVEKVPNNSRAHIDLGDTYRAQLDLEKALASYTKATELNPKDMVGFSKSGHANSFLGNYDAARKNFQDARAVSEFGTNSYNFEAYTYIYEGDHAKAMTFLNDAMTEIDGLDIPESNKNGTKLNCGFNNAMIAMHHGDAAGLKSIVDVMKPLSDKVGKDVGSKGAIHNNKCNNLYWDAMAAAVGGDYANAAAISETLKSELEKINDPNNMRRYHRIHSYVNYQQGNYDKALEHVAELNVDNVYDQYWMAKINQEAGNAEKAKELYLDVVDNNFNSVGYALIRNEVKEIVGKFN